MAISPTARLAVMLLLLASCVPRSYAGCPYSEARVNEARKRDATSASALMQANLFLFSAYDTSKAKLFRQFVDEAPLIFVGLTDLTMMLGNTNTTIVFQTADIDAMKMVDHTALTAYVLLSPLVVQLPTSQWGIQVALDSNTSTSIGSFLAILAQVNATLPTAANWNGTLPRQQFIVNSVMQFLSNTLSTGSISKNQLDSFSSSVGSALMDNINYYAIAILNLKHQQMMLWQTQLSTQQWNTMRIVILSSHMARWNQQDLLYFCRLLNTPINSGLRVMYAEGIFDPASSFSLVGTHLEDFQVGYSFFGSAEFMHYDILSTPTQAYLPKLFSGASRSLGVSGTLLVLVMCVASLVAALLSNSFK